MATAKYVSNIDIADREAVVTSSIRRPARRAYRTNETLTSLTVSGMNDEKFIGVGTDEARWTYQTSESPSAVTYVTFEGSCWTPTCGEIKFRAFIKGYLDKSSGRFAVTKPFQGLVHHVLWLGIFVISAGWLDSSSKESTSQGDVTLLPCCIAVRAFKSGHENVDDHPNM